MMITNTNKAKLKLRRVCSLRLSSQGSMAWGHVHKLEEVQKMLNEFQDVYRIELDLVDEWYNVNTGHTRSIQNIKNVSLWVSDEITTPAQIELDNPGARFRPEITSANQDVPAVRTTSSNCTGARPLKCWTPVDRELDIVVDRQLKQIFPKKTGEIPVVLADLMQHVR